MSYDNWKTDAPGVEAGCEAGECKNEGCWSCPICNAWLCDDVNCGDHHSCYNAEDAADARQDGEWYERN